MGKRYSYISLIAAVSCLAVVILHANGCFWSFSTEWYWKIANVIECLAYFAVPCFFMISGATLMDFRERYSLKQYFLKRIQKTVIPFVFWSFAGLAYQILVAKTVRKADLGVLFVYNGIARTSFTGIYWFFVTLFGVYLCIPLFAAVQKEARKEIFTYVAIAGFIINSVIPFLIRLTGKEIAWPISLQVASGALLYIPTGYLLHEYEISRKVRIVLYSLAAVGLLTHFAGTYALSVKAGGIVETFKGYYNVPCVLYAVGIFTFFRCNGEKIMRFAPVQKAVTLISGYSFAIYLMHWYLLDLLRRVFDIDTKLMAYRIGAPILVVAICMGITFVLQKIPFVKRIVP